MFPLTIFGYGILQVILLLLSIIFRAKPRHRFMAVANIATKIAEKAFNH